MSKFNYLSHAAIDRVKWDRCIIDCGYALMYGMSWYLDQVSPGWGGLVLEEKGVYKAVFPVTWKQKFGIKYMYRPFMVQQLGLFTLDHERQESYLVECLQLLMNRFRYIDYSLNEVVHINNSHRLTAFFQIQQGLTYLLDLQRPYQEIQQGYHANLRRNIKKARQHHITISHEPGALDELVCLYRAHKGKELQKVGGKEYQLLEQVYKQVQQQGLGLLLTARSQEGELLAGAIYFLFQDRLTYIFGGSSTRGRELRAMPLLMDECIKQQAGKVLRLDFEGSIIPSLARYYSSFGARPVSFDMLRYNRLPYLLRLIKK